MTRLLHNMMTGVLERAQFEQGEFGGCRCCGCFAFELRSSTTSWLGLVWLSSTKRPKQKKRYPLVNLN